VRPLLERAVIALVIVVALAATALMAFVPGDSFVVRLVYQGF
jgi:hypothetical protein